MDVERESGLREKTTGNMFAQSASSGLGLREFEVLLGHFHRREYDCCGRGAWSFKALARTNGKVVQSIGKVKTMCAFAKDTNTRVKCWFYVFNNLAAPLIVGSEFLEKTKTMSTFTNRLENRLPDGKAILMFNFIGFTHRSKRRFVALIDGRQTRILADSGSDLDLMSSTYVRAHGYETDRRRECRKRIQIADSSLVESIGQVRAELTLADGSNHIELFDVLFKLTFDVLLDETSLEEIEAFTVHKNSFVEVVASEHNTGLCTLGYLGKVNACLVRHLKRGERDRIQEPRKYNLPRKWTYSVINLEPIASLANSKTTL